MPVETATYIHDLNAADPVHTDALNLSDTHIRLIKTTLQNTLPNFTGPVTATPAELNAAGTAHAQAGVMEVAANGTVAGGAVVLDPVPGSGSVTIQNVGTAGNSGTAAVVIKDRTNGNPVSALTITQAGVVTTPPGGAFNSGSIQKFGNELLPTGIICMWSGLVASIPAGWHLCDGTAGTPNLRNSFIIGAGSTYAPGQTGGAASTTPTTSSAGAHSHGGATAVAGPFGMSGSSDAQGTHSHGGATGATALDITMIPPHNHGLGGNILAYGSGSPIGNLSGGAIVGYEGVATEGSGAGHVHGIAADGNHAHNIFVSNSPAHQHGLAVDGNHNHTVTVATMPPYYALAFIMKL